MSSCMSPCCCPSLSVPHHVALYSVPHFSFSVTLILIISFLNILLRRSIRLLEGRLRLLTPQSRQVQHTSQAYTSSYPSAHRSLRRTFHSNCPPNLIPLILFSLSLFLLSRTKLRTRERKQRWMGCRYCSAEAATIPHSFMSSLGHHTK